MKSVSGIKSGYHVLHRQWLVRRKPITRTILIILFLGFGPLRSTAQQIHFAKSYFSNARYEMTNFTELSDSGFIMQGEYSYGTAGPYYDLLVRLNKYGDTVFTRSYNIPTSGLRGIANFNDSNVISSGGFNLNGYGVNTMNINIYTGDTSGFSQYGYYQQGVSGSIAKCSDKGYVMINPVSLDYGILKIDSLKNVQWHTWYNMSNGCYNIVQDPFGGFIACGSNGWSGNLPYNVLSLDDSGNVRWQHSYGNNPFNLDEYPIGIAVMEDSNYLISCKGYDWHLMKLNRYTGDTIWTKLTSTLWGIISLVNAGNNRYMGLGQTKLYLFDENGDTIYTRDYPWPLDNYWPAILKRSSDGGYVYSGYYYPIPGNPYIQLPALVKTDSLGNAVFTSVFNPENNMQPLTVYPNPATTQLYISPGSMAAERNVTFTLYDIQGRVTLQQQCDGTHPVDVSTVPTGLYIGALKGKEKEVRGKVMIQR